MKLPTTINHVHKINFENKRYIVELNNASLLNSFFYKTIKTNQQIKTIMTEAIKAGALESVEKGTSLLKFSSFKGDALLLLFTCKKHPESEKVGAYFELLKLYRKSSQEALLLEQAIPQSNTFVLRDFKLVYHARPRTMDTFLEPTRVKGKSFKLAIAQYPLESKDWFFERYDTRALLTGIVSRVLADELAPTHADNGIFWIRAEEEGDSSALKSYWLALSLTSFKYKKEKGLALLLDNVHQDKHGNEILSLARESGEVFLKKPVLLKTKSPQNKKKGNQGGLVIKKKATKIIALTMFALSLFSTSTHALDGESKGRDLYASCVSCHGETGIDTPPRKLNYI